MTAPVRVFMAENDNASLCLLTLSDRSIQVVHFSCLVSTAVTQPF